MRVWFVCFLLLFGAVELYQWVANLPWLHQNLTLPMPAFLLGGVVLAIASNYNKRAGLPWKNWLETSERQFRPSPAASPVEGSVTSTQPSPDLPNFAAVQPGAPISFTIRKPENPSGS